MSSFLNILSQVEEKADRKTHMDYNHLITMNQENGKSLSSSNYVVTSNDTQHNHVITVVRSNSTELIGIGSASVSPDSSSSQPPFWDTINYFIFHASWWLGGWSENYGQNDNFNLYLTGQAAASFNSEWIADTASPTVFWYNVPFWAYGQFAGVYFSSQLTGISADFAWEVYNCL